MKAGVVIGVILGAFAILAATNTYPDLGPGATSQVWFMAGFTPVVGLVFGIGRILSDFFPRMVFGCCAVLAPATLVAAIICLFTDQTRFVAPFAVWAVTSTAAVWASSRISASIELRIARGNAALEAEAARTTCPSCGQEVQALPGVCPWCGQRLAPWGGGAD